MSDPLPPKTTDFDQVMLAMDVVDTLRHQEGLVERELSAEANDRALAEKVRGMYAAQGIAVSDELISEAVAALREGRFAYRPPRPDWRLTLARIYANRGRWFKIVSLLAAVWLVVAVGYRLFVKMPETQRLEEMTALREALLIEVQEPQVRDRVETLFSDAQAAAKRGDTPAVRRALAELTRLADAVRQAYELRIVSRADIPSGVWRIPDVNTQARNYYILVEAIDSNGQRLKLPITSEEDNRTEMVEMWGVRVSPAVFETIRQDKADDGIIQNKRFGEKKRGYLSLTYRFPTTGAAITRW